MTEPVAATPLADLLERHALTPLQAAALAARLARVLQASHDQGACYRRLAPEWILVRGDLEPVVCPCGVPSESPAERARDVAALGTMLLAWLPARSRRWRSQPLAPLYHVCDAAGEGRYASAVELADDLDRAARAARVRRRQLAAHAGLLALLALPPLAFVAHLIWVMSGAPESDWPFADLVTGGVLAGYLLLTACPAAFLLGLLQARAFVLNRRLRLRAPAAALPTVGRLFLVLLAALLALPVAALIWPPLLGTTSDGPSFLTALTVLGELAGYWLLGVWLAGLTVLAGFFAGSMRNIKSHGATHSGER